LIKGTSINQNLSRLKHLLIYNQVWHILLSHGIESLIADSNPVESFRPLLEKGCTQDRKMNAGRKRIDPLILFKMLVLHQFFSLSRA
jgi:hypothetical protein